jgi:hypothetical protein
LLLSFPREPELPPDDLSAFPDDPLDVLLDEPLDDPVRLDVPLPPEPRMPLSGLFVDGRGVPVDEGVFDVPLRDEPEELPPKPPDVCDELELPPKPPDVPDEPEEPLCPAVLFGSVRGEAFGSRLVLDAPSPWFEVFFSSAMLPPCPDGRIRRRPAAQPARAASPTSRVVLA